MEFLADQTGVDRVAQEAIALVTELRDALVINRQHPEDLPPKLVITARLDQAYLTGWLTGLVARALLHKALRAGEISKKERNYPVDKPSFGLVLCIQSSIAARSWAQNIASPRSWASIRFCGGPGLLDRLAAKLRCLPVSDHAAKFLFITSCCCC